MNDAEPDAGPTPPMESCLHFLCRHFEAPVAESTLRAKVSGVAGQDLDMAQFRDAARKAGLAVAIGRQKLEKLTAADLPVVALYADGGARVLTRMLDDGRIVAHDPAFGPDVVTLGRDEVLAGHSGFCLAVRPDDRAGVRRVGAARADGHWFWGALRANRWSYTQVMLAAALTNMLGLAVSVFIMVVYDRVLPNNATESLIALTFGVAIVIAFEFLLKTLRAEFIDAAGRRADMAMGVRIFDHLLDMQMRSRKGSVGAFASTLREFESLRDFFASASLAALVDLPFIALFLFVIFQIGGPLALVPGLAVPVVLLIGVAVQPLLARCAAEAFKEGQTKQGVLIETISGLETIKTAGAAPLMRKRWEDSIRHQSGVGARTRRISQFAMNAAASAQQVVQVGVVFVGVFLIAAGETSMGALVACVMLSGRALAPLGQLAQTMTRMNQARTSFRALDALMGEQTERRDDRRYVSRPRLSGRIEFRDVSFTYPGQTLPALKNVSFVIEPGEKVAVLGRIGSGKSTMMRLLLGLYEPDAGAILIDDTDIRQLEPADLRANVAAVLQDVWLFTGTVRENIAIGRPRATDAEMVQASMLAGVHDFVGRHPQGYDMMLAERGEGLSGGQRQSIAMARALIADAPVMVMDEPTSAMDMQSEQQTLARLKPWAEGRTLILVTHRTSLLALADRVLIFDGGRLTGDGPRDAAASADARPTRSLAAARAWRVMEADPAEPVAAATV